MTTPVRVAMIGTGGMAQHHLRIMLNMQESTQVVVLCEPSPLAYALASQIFEKHGLPVPPNEPDLKKLLKDYNGQLDAAFVITPHALHHDEVVACMEAGLDVLLEKPMVINVPEALDLIEKRDRTGRLLVIAFQGSLSPQIRHASNMLRSGELGQILNISGTVWQNWGPNTANTWRQVPALAGGGFLFDTGAHMLNTVADLAGEDFVEVAAWFDNNNRPVETRAAVMGRLQSGALVTINACGETIPSCESSIHVFCTKGIMYTDQWGKWLQVQRYGRRRLRTVTVPPSMGVWEQFLSVRAGQIANPSPPEIGLRMTRLWDAIKESAALNGQPVKTSSLQVAERMT